MTVKVYSELYLKLRIIHRDIKLENILLNENGTIKLCDFGCATFSQKKNSEMLMKRSFCGTISYLSPEMINGIYDKDVDVWSLGVACYELNAGYSPFNRENEELTFDAIRNINIDYPNYFSEDLIDFLKGIFKYNVQDRYQIKDLINHKWLNRNLENS
ncbi:protein kinase domain protein [Ichthyophthirius multifiliis]|uniref:Protein kinase domain protein n=1 Tax=Ichthyophthirius multifiliis TaxID=5932 RepID=G0R151_ICHMU|nr:protein kinase domain protein [Ichthyophthirius multifiliis]EGR28818.1 protein kinase domain protein [Ichthyophthirius multifiliis]|eukprot:XP_004030054.1 protein kinase domain protein [Ichthyophthirius multifiliis]